MDYLQLFLCKRLLFFVVWGDREYAPRRLAEKSRKIDVNIWNDVGKRIKSHFWVAVSFHSRIKKRTGVVGASPAAYTGDKGISRMPMSCFPGESSKNSLLKMERMW